MTDALIRDVVRLLHSRGREVTPAEVAAWLDVTVHRWNRMHPDKIIDADLAAQAVLRGSPWLTMAMHLRFGDALR